MATHGNDWAAYIHTYYTDHPIMYTRAPKETLNLVLQSMIGSRMYIHTHASVQYTQTQH